MSAEYVPLFPLLADYWDKPLSELPEALQARVSPRVGKQFIDYKPKLDTNGLLVREVKLLRLPAENGKRYELKPDAEEVEVYPIWEESYIENEVGDFIHSWDALTPGKRQYLVRQLDDQRDPKNKEEAQYYFDLQCELTATENEITKCELMNHQNIPSEAKKQRQRMSELRAKLTAIKQREKLPPSAAPVEQPAPAAEVQTAPVKTTAKGGRPKTINKKANAVRQIIEAFEKTAGIKFSSNDLPGSAADLLDSCQRMEKAKTNKGTVFGTSKNSLDKFNTWLKAAGYGFSPGRTLDTENNYWTKLCPETMALITPEVFTEVYNKATP